MDPKATFFPAPVNIFIFNDYESSSVCARQIVQKGAKATIRKSKNFYAVFQCPSYEIPKPLGPTVLETYCLLRRGDNLKKIAAIRRVKVSTIYTDINTLLKINICSLSDIRHLVKIPENISTTLLSYIQSQNLRERTGKEVVSLLADKSPGLELKQYYLLLSEAYRLTLHELQ